LRDQGHSRRNASLFIERSSTRLRFSDHAVRRKSAKLASKNLYIWPFAVGVRDTDRWDKVGLLCLRLAGSLAKRDKPYDKQFVPKVARFYSNTGKGRVNIRRW